MVGLPCLGEGEFDMKNRDVIERNLDVEHVMHASCKYGLHKFGRHNPEKLLSVLVVTDVHQCEEQLKSAIKYLNYYDAVDLGINLGDIQARNYIETDGTWYYEAIKDCKKPFLSLLGNHDLGQSADKTISATPDAAFQKFLKRAMEKAQIENVETPYYSKRLDEYKTVIIALNSFDVPSVLDTDGNFAVSRGVMCFSQKQIDWFVNELNRVSSGYGVVICMHNFPYEVDVIRCLWSQKDVENVEVEENCYADGDMIADVVDAWVNGSALNAVYTSSKKDILPDIKIDCDFGKRVKGDFIAYFIGHRHKDVLAECRKYKNQKVVFFPATAADDWQNFCSDLPREVGTKSEDAITVVSIDRKERELRLVRIGSNITWNMEKREYFVLKY